MKNIFSFGVFKKAFTHLPSHVLMMIRRENRFLKKDLSHLFIGIKGIARCIYVTTVLIVIGVLAFILSTALNPLAVLLLKKIEGYMK
jgi:hypothetical protein